jgi:hypothetical protein
VILKATRGRRSFRFRAIDPDSRYVRILRADGWTITRLDVAEVTR